MIKFTPKRFKYNRSFTKRKIEGNKRLFRNLHVDRYQVGFMAMEDTYLFRDEVMSIYRFLKKALDKKMKIRFHLDFVQTYTSKSVGMRMGKGKGPRREFFSIVRMGAVFIEIYLDKKLDFRLKEKIQKVLDGLKKRVSFKIKPV